MATVYLFDLELAIRLKDELGATSVKVCDDQCFNGRFVCRNNEWDQYEVDRATAKENKKPVIGLFGSIHRNVSKIVEK